MSSSCGREVGSLESVADNFCVGTFAVTLRVTDVLGQSVLQTYSISVATNNPLLPPVITTQPLVSATLGVTYSQQITARDPQDQAITYALTSYPVGMTIDPQGGLIQWMPNGVGSVPVTVVATDTSGLKATLKYTLTAHTNVPPTLLSSPPTTVTAGTPFQYDILASGNGDTLTYTLIGGPQGMAVDGLGRLTWNPTIADIGTEHVVVNVTSSGGLTTPVDFYLAIVADTQAPSVVLITSASQVDMGTSFTVAVKAADNVGVTSLTLTANGVPVALLPATSGSGGTATLSYDTAQTITLVATATDAAGNAGTVTSAVTVVDPSVTQAPVASITSPTNNADITAPISVTGTVSDPQDALLSWTLSITPDDSGELPSSDPVQAQNGPSKVIATGTTAITNGTLGTLDPTVLANGSYTLTLTALNAGGLTSTTYVPLSVSKNLKLGALNLSFTDLTVPSVGIPITVTRTYSSLTADTQGDFGYGWSLGLSNTKVQIRHQNNALSGFGDYVPMEDGDRVIITLPDGTKDSFTFEAAPGETLFGIPIDYTPTFVPDAGTRDQLLVNSASLTQVGDEYVNEETGDSYNPALAEFGGSYTLQLHNGTQLVIDATTGDLNQVVDTNGNTLTFTGDGIESSSGQSIEFTRDYAGRITSITSSGGQTVSYQYDNSGNLIAFTDAAGNTTQFTYFDDPAHYLETIIAPNGVQAAAAQYDASGRISSITDAQGNSTNFSYDLGAKSQTTYDQLDNPTTTYYDSDGNPIEVINALGGITLNTYDSNDDLLSTTVETAEGPLTTTYTYDQFGDQTSVTNPDGTKTSTTYNTFGQPLSQTDSLGNTTRYNYNDSGEITSSVDAQGNVTRYTYDNNGNPVSTTDPFGHVTTYDYDFSGNLLTTTDPFGHVTTFSYNSQGLATSSTSQWVNSPLKFA